MDDLQETLNGPGYFDCEKTNCRVKVSVCIGRQKANRERTGFERLPYAICENCDQGKGHMENADPAIQAIPRRGKGSRNLNCPVYETCLDKAVARNWQSWNCDKCFLTDGEKRMTEGTESKGPGRICEECHEKPTIHPKNPLCASCMAKRSNNTPRKAKKTPKPGRTQKADGRRNNGEGKGPGRGEIVRPRGDLTLVIDFQKYPDIFDQVNRAAETEMRPVDLQVIYLLRNSLGSK